MILRENDDIEIGGRKDGAVRIIPGGGEYEFRSFERTIGGFGLMNVHYRQIEAAENNDNRLTSLRG